MNFVDPAVSTNAIFGVTLRAFDTRLSALNFLMSEKRFVCIA